MAGHFNHDVISGMKDAAVKVLWTKSDLRSMLVIAGVDQVLDMLAGRQQQIHSERDRKSAPARQQRPLRRQQAA